LKDSFVDFSDPCSGAENPGFGCFGLVLVYDRSDTDFFNKLWSVFDTQLIAFRLRTWAREWIASS
jgi:hypothetical protein